MSESNSNKQYKRVPFDIELAKKIQSGEIEGRIVTSNGYAVRIICFDKRTSSGYPILGLVDYPSMSEMCKSFNVQGLCYDQPYDQPVEYVLQIELPEEAPICNNPDSPRCKICSNIHCNDCQYNTPKHEFKPFDRVLVRGGRSTAIQERNIWVPAYYQHHDYSRYVGDDEIYFASGLYWKECIPFAGNEHLVGTTNNPE